MKRLTPSWQHKQVGYLKGTGTLRLYREIATGIPFYQVARKFDITEDEVRTAFHSRDYNNYLNSI